MFQFRRFPTYCYLIHSTLLEVCSSGLPHSDISGSMLICSSPKLFAAYHVLHRLLMPRHSPCALYSLTLSSRLSSRSNAISGSLQVNRRIMQAHKKLSPFWLIVITLKNNCSLLLPSHNLHHFLHGVQFSRCIVESLRLIEIPAWRLQSTLKS